MKYLCRKTHVSYGFVFFRSIIAPKLSKHGKLWSNFWGEIGYDGFYQRSRDYVEIVNNEKK